MTKSELNAAWGLAFVLVGGLGLWLGLQRGEQQAKLDLWCDGESAYQLQVGMRPAWLVTRFSLDLSPTGLSHLRFAGRLLDAQSGAGLGVMHRYSSFQAQHKGHRLLIKVTDSVKSETDNLNPELVSSLGLFFFKPGGSLSLWMQAIGEPRYLLDDGAEAFVLCRRRLQQPATEKPWTPLAGALVLRPGKDA